MFSFQMVWTVWKRNQNGSHFGHHSKIGHIQPSEIKVPSLYSSASWVRESNGLNFERHLKMATILVELSYAIQKFGQHYDIL